MALDIIGCSIAYFVRTLLIRELVTMLAVFSALIYLDPQINFGIDSESFAFALVTIAVAFTV